MFIWQPILYHPIRYHNYREINGRSLYIRGHAGWLALKKLAPGRFWWHVEFHNASAGKGRRHMSGYQPSLYRAACRGLQSLLSARRQPLPALMDQMRVSQILFGLSNVGEKDSL